MRRVENCDADNHSRLCGIAGDFAAVGVGLTRGGRSSNRGGAAIHVGVGVTTGKAFLIGADGEGFGIRGFKINFSNGLNGS